MEYSVIIPTLNAGNQLDKLLTALEEQTVRPQRILVIDSESEDDTGEIASAHELVEFEIVKRETFNHGGTRNLAVHRCTEPFFVMMTQDALPMAETCMEELLRPLEDSGVAAVCARQVAYPHSSEYEKAVRAFRYPEESRVWSAQDVSALGIRAYLLSDVCTVYRRSAFEAVGGFTEPLMTNEDMLIAAAFLEVGFSLAYSGKAAVWHSHDYTFRQEYERNRKIGQFMAEYGQRFGEGGEMGEGVRLVRDVTGQLIRQGHGLRVFPFFMNCTARMLGNAAGKRGKPQKV